MVHETGTLGPSVRAKVPVVDPNSQRVIGEVSVGISTAAVHQQLWSNLRTSAVLGGVALLVGGVGSILLARRWRVLTLGLRPAEMAELVRGQAAVLHGIGEGVIAADPDWQTTFVNEEACRLLDISDDVGRPVADIGLTPRVLAVFRAVDSTPTLATVGERIVVVSARSVDRDGHQLGTVLVVRDRTDVESLTRQLDAVQLMSTALRAQRHEFANRLHLLNGLLHAGHTEEAAQYVEELLGTGPLGSAVPGIEAVRDPFLQAFLAAKAAGAREAGVTLTIGENTWVAGRLALPVDVTTVLGNLLDNAIDATRGAPGDVKEVEVELVTENSTLFITVADSGTGVRPDFVDELFVEGTTTKPDSGILSILHPGFANHNGGWLAFGPDGSSIIGHRRRRRRPAIPPKMRRTQRPARQDAAHRRASDDFPADPRATMRFPPTIRSPAAGGAPGNLGLWSAQPVPRQLRSRHRDLYIGDVGQGAREEIDLMRPADGGANYGWRICRGDAALRRPAEPGLTPPVAEYSTAPARARATR